MKTFRYRCLSKRSTADHLRWWDVLTFTTYVDGESWRYRRSLIGVSHRGGTRSVGESWIGRGRELVYAGCDGSGEMGLEEDTYTVEMTGRLPGTDGVIASNSIEVELSCDDVPPHGWPYNAAPPSPRRSPLVVVLLAVGSVLLLTFGVVVCRDR